MLLGECHYIYIYMADSQIVYSEMVAERKTEESIPYDSKKHRGSIEESIPPCVRIATGCAFLTRRGVLTARASGLLKLKYCLLLFITEKRSI